MSFLKTEHFGVWVGDGRVQFSKQNKIFVRILSPKLDLTLRI